MWKIAIGGGDEETPKLDNSNLGNCAIEYCKYSIAILFLEKSGI